MKKINIKLNIASSLTAILIVLFAAFPVFASTITEDIVIEMVNQSRTEQGIPVLQENEKLNQAAELKADDMIANNYFAHTSPAGLSPWHWFGKTNYEYHYAGENLAMNFTVAEKQHASWMASPSHRKNILNGNYSEIGVSVRKGNIGGHETIIVVQEFGAPFGVVPAEYKEQVSGEQDMASVIPDPKPINLATNQDRYAEVANPAVVLGLMIVLMLIAGAGINIAIIRDAIRYRRLGISEVRM